jgi:very-short-patch-repair endonuclease
VGKEKQEKMRNKILPYNPKLKPFARQLRNNMTLSEILLWEYLKNKKMKGFDFDRQRPIDEFIVDFYCKELMLAIEIDGSTHDDETSWQRSITTSQTRKTRRTIFTICRPRYKAQYGRCPNYN